MVLVGEANKGAATESRGISLALCNDNVCRTIWQQNRTRTWFRTMNCAHSSGMAQPMIAVESWTFSIRSKRRHLKIGEIGGESAAREIVTVEGEVSAGKTWRVLIRKKATVALAPQRRKIARIECV